MKFLKLFVDKWVDIGYNKNVPKRDTKILQSHGLKTEVNYGKNNRKRN